MAWLPDGEKNSKISLFVLTECTNVTDRQTDTHTDKQTPHDDIGHACIARQNSVNTSQSYEQISSGTFFMTHGVHMVIY